MALKLDTASLILQPIHSFFIRSNLSLLMWLARKCLSPCEFRITSHPFYNMSPRISLASLPNANRVRGIPALVSICRRVWNQNRKWKQAWRSYKKGECLLTFELSIFGFDFAPPSCAIRFPDSWLPLRRHGARPRNPTTPPKQPYFSLLLLFFILLEYLILYLPHLYLPKVTWISPLTRNIKSHQRKITEKTHNFCNKFKVKIYQFAQAEQKILQYY